MLKTSINIVGLDKLQKEIKLVDKLILMKTDKSFQSYIKKHCLSILNDVMSNKLGGTTNDDSKELYIASNHIKDTEDGFIIYNDATIEAEVSENKQGNYENGFSIALAFEYGVGIVGQNSPKLNAWQYNINNYNFGWNYVKDGVVYGTFGYEGLEIYRYTADGINKNLNKWVNEYYRKIGV